MLGSNVSLLWSFAPQQWLGNTYDDMWEDERGKGGKRWKKPYLLDAALHAGLPLWAPIVGGILNMTIETQAWGSYFKPQHQLHFWGTITPTIIPARMSMFELQFPKFPVSLKSHYPRFCRSWLWSWIRRDTISAYSIYIGVGNEMEGEEIHTTPYHHHPGHVLLWVPLNLYALHFWWEIKSETY